MNQRSKRRNRFADNLENALDNVESIMIHIVNIEAKRGTIEDRYIDDELKNSYIDLEIEMALVAVILRKLSESQFIELLGDRREDVNTLIHSNRFEYQKLTHKVFVYSHKSQEVVDVAEFLKYGRKIVDKLDNPPSLV